MLTSPSPPGWPLGALTSALTLPPSLLSESASKGISTWLDLLVTWNARIDLTAARSNEELIDLMVVDALLLSAHLPQRATVVDVGTGAGAPGLALALLRPDLRVTLVEPLVKRASFLRTVIGTLNRLDITLERTKAADIINAKRTFDVAMARATLPPEEWLRTGLDLVPTGGAVWALLAKEPAPSDPRAPQGDAEIVYAWPNTQVTRRLVRYEKTSA